MKVKIFCTSVALGLLLSAFGQSKLELTFTAINNTANVQLDSIKVMNRTQAEDTVLYWPDTVLVLDYQSAINEFIIGEKNLQVFQNYPNPVIDHTTISLFIPTKDKVDLIITDMLGRVILKSEMVLDKGVHFFKFTPGNGSFFFFTANWRGKNSTIRILQATSNCNRVSSFTYMGGKHSAEQFKNSEFIQSFSYALEDELLYIGYTAALQSGMLDAPKVSKTYSFQFATNIPCPETPTVTYEGQVYNTIQVFSQCWLKENLNVGAMIEGNHEMEDNGIIEKYCCYNDPDSCTKYGGLYQWWEMMQYDSITSVQGICPPGWHLPSDEEWKVLEGAVDSQYGIGDQIWDVEGDRGFNLGTHLKNSSGWYNGGNGTNIFDFTSLPGGTRYPDGSFQYILLLGEWWTSTESNSEEAFHRSIGYSGPKVRRFNFPVKETGRSVRCVRDN